MSHRLVPASSTVYTPELLATAMVRALGDENESVWVDPCVGDGAFVAVIAALGVPKNRILAFELATMERERDTLARTKRGVDFVAWASRRSGVCDRVVMNPPYVAMSRLRGKPRAAALAVPILNEGARIPLKANYWCAFVLSGMRSLRAGGSMAAVLPAAWDYARYARRIRDAVTLGFGEMTVVRSASPMFPGVLEGAVVVVARKRGQQPCVVRRVEVAGADEAVQTLTTLGEGKHLRAATMLRAIGRMRRKEMSLHDLMDIRIGGVTGDAHYFLLTEGERKERGLPQAALRPVVTRCRHLRRPFLDRTEWERLLEQGERVWLFSPSGNALRHDAVCKYLRRGRRGACQIDGYKIQARDPWYQTPMPRRVDGFLSGMSKRLPLLVMRQMPGLTATNTLYVVRFKLSVDVASRMAVGVSLLSSRVRRDLEARARVYADGLLKFEPAELRTIQVALPDRFTGARSAFSKATRLLLDGREQDAEAFADEWLAGDARIQERDDCPAETVATESLSLHASVG